ncbi:unnamed protein product [Prorocentrum cordatum]|uniref:Uncharacterized protein n=1 Tax=Prorocentrum cordatum TaxID=2364126 RepID=A0ABN9V670_9DINO|nr:unnamed protein product [Polarella glacialis]
MRRDLRREGVPDTAGTRPAGAAGVAAGGSRRARRERGARRTDDLPLAHNVWSASIFVHRSALVHCCRLMDVEALGLILGRPFTAGDLLELEKSIGDTLMDPRGDYQSALNDFSVSFDSHLATRMTQSVMMPF